ncbi:cytotoxic translational repressor of toxin-antitoxin stability system [Streptomyces gelaticus]|uniref:Cytotoxic translational repressor of toxin-antitoxin stability system n=1 Tax=Streptomyces gelaticus TaxID=285446 RepID=A0ABQ2W683_9ACTN|nr:type II toxin-antitoxin system RelE/ParE family toxin [Streptomyces gelaticus]GGV94112.1 cytotoxic translational repressor of toxin-antitoxin stability system [Streptomyces gelaticus]
MGHVTRFTSHAQRDLLKIPRQDAPRILIRLSELQKALDTGDVAAFDVKALQGHADRWRLRIGDYRAVYTIEDGRLILWVLTVGQRREVYRGR